MCQTVSLLKCVDTFFLFCRPKKGGMGYWVRNGSGVFTVDQKWFSCVYTHCFSHQKRLFSSVLLLLFLFCLQKDNDVLAEVCHNSLFCPTNNNSISDWVHCYLHCLGYQKCKRGDLAAHSESTCSGKPWLSMIKHDTRLFHARPCALTMGEFPRYQNSVQTLYLTKVLWTRL